MLECTVDIVVYHSAYVYGMFMNVCILCFDVSPELIRVSNKRHIAVSTPASEPTPQTARDLINKRAAIHFSTAPHAAGWIMCSCECVMNIGVD